MVDPDRAWRRWSRRSWDWYTGLQTRTLLVVLEEFVGMRLADPAAIAVKSYHLALDGKLSILVFFGFSRDAFSVAKRTG